MGEQGTLAALAMPKKMAQMEPFHVSGAEGTEAKCHPPVAYSLRTPPAGWSGTEAACVQHLQETLRTDWGFKAGG